MKKIALIILACVGMQAVSHEVQGAARGRGPRTRSAGGTELSRFMLMARALTDVTTPFTAWSKLEDAATSAYPTLTKTSEQEYYTQINITSFPVKSWPQMLDRIDRESAGASPTATEVIKKMADVVDHARYEAAVAAGAMMSPTATWEDKLAQAAVHAAGTGTSGIEFLGGTVDAPAKERSTTEHRLCYSFVDLLNSSAYTAAVYEKLKSTALAMSRVKKAPMTDALHNTILVKKLDSLWVDTVRTQLISWINSPAGAAAGATIADASMILEFIQQFDIQLGSSTSILSTTGLGGKVNSGALYTQADLVARHFNGPVTTAAMINLVRFLPEMAGFKASYDVCVAAGTTSELKQLDWNRLATRLTAADADLEQAFIMTACVPALKDCVQNFLIPLLQAKLGRAGVQPTVALTAIPRNAHMIDAFTNYAIFLPELDGKAAEVPSRLYAKSLISLVLGEAGAGLPLYLNRGLGLGAPALTPDDAVLDVLERDLQDHIDAGSDFTAVSKKIIPAIKYYYWTGADYILGGQPIGSYFQQIVPLVDNAGGGHARPQLAAAINWLIDKLDATDFAGGRKAPVKAGGKTATAITTKAATIGEVCDAIERLYQVSKNPVADPATIAATCKKINKDAGIVLDDVRRIAKGGAWDARADFEAPAFNVHGYTKPGGGADVAGFCRALSVAIVQKFGAFEKVSPASMVNILALLKEVSVAKTGTMPPLEIKQEDFDRMETGTVIARFFDLLTRQNATRCFTDKGTIKELSMLGQVLGAYQRAGTAPVLNDDLVVRQINDVCQRNTTLAAAGAASANAVLAILQNIVTNKVLVNLAAQRRYVEMWLVNNYLQSRIIRGIIAGTSMATINFISIKPKELQTAMKQYGAFTADEANACVAFLLLQPVFTAGVDWTQAQNKDFCTNAWDAVKSDASSVAKVQEFLAWAYNCNNSADHATYGDAEAYYKAFADGTLAIGRTLGADLQRICGELYP